MNTQPPGWLDLAVQRTDWFRRPPSRVGGRPGFKEWQHFCIYGRDFDLLLNLSEVDPVATTGSPVVRLTALARYDRWFGNVETIPAEEVNIRAGRMHAEFGSSSIRYQDGRYRLNVKCRSIPVEAELELQPHSMPAPIYNVMTGDGPPIHWVVLPRLVAHGVVRLDGTEHRLDGTPAYHDHNWGHFRWGRDFAWEWGFGLPQDPANPWSFVFARLSNRKLTRTRMQTLFLWKGRRVHRAFRDANIRIEHHGLLRADRVLKVPPVMGLIARGTATDVPARMSIEAWSDDTRLEASFTPKDIAQVVLPNDDDFGVTIINEVAGDLEVRANVAGERVELTCPTIFEFLGA